MQSKLRSRYVFSIMILLFVGNESESQLLLTLLRAKTSEWPEYLYKKSFKFPSGRELSYDCF